MFALDNLVRDAVQAAVTVLSPELGANLAGHAHHEGNINVKKTFDSQSRSD